MILTFFATIVLAVVIMVELLSLSHQFAFRKTRLFNTPCKEQYASIAQNLRISNFLTSTFSYMCLSFSALQIKEWNQGVFGMSPGISAALSISICTLAEAAGMCVMPLIAKKLKSRTLMSISTIVLIVSNLACFLTASTAVMILMRFTAGIGFAGNKQVNNLIITRGYGTEEERKANLSSANTGIIGGILCGMGMGSVIAGIFGYAATFLGAGIGCIGYLLFNYFMVPWRLIMQDKPREEGESKADAKGLVKALLSPKVWTQAMLVVVPQYFFLMVIVSLIPGRIQSAELPSLLLTYCNLLNGLIGLYLAEFVSRLFFKNWKRTRILGAMFLSGVIAMLMIELPFKIVMLLISAILCGLIDGIGTPLATDIFLETKELTEQMDESTILLLYTIIGFAVMTAAPIVLELCEKSLLWMYGSCAVLGVSAVLLFLKRGEKQTEKT